MAPKAKANAGSLEAVKRVDFLSKAAKIAAESQSAVGKRLSAHLGRQLVS